MTRAASAASGLHANNGRKPASESRAAEIRERLAAWRQTPEPRRISLRALAAELGTSHQLLSFYLQGWDKWQMKEYRRKAHEIRDRAKTENRSMMPLEEASVDAYERAAHNSMLANLWRDALKRLKQEASSGKLSGRMLEKYLKLLGSRGYRKEAEQLLKLVLTSEIERSR